MLASKDLLAFEGQQRVLTRMKALTRMEDDLPLR